MNIKKLLFGSILAISASICLHTVASACTAVYVGKGVSANGTTIIARTVEWQTGYMSCVDSYAAKKHKEGDYYEDSGSGFKFEYPTQTCKYLLANTMDYAEDGKTTDVCINEYGVAISATVTAYANENALKADPLVEDGICEGSISLILGSSSKTAKEAVELLGDYIDKYGSAESNSLFIADQNEAWYFEIYTGHQYAAIKMPEDKVSVVCNQFMLGSFDINDSDVYYSKDLVNIAKKNKFAVFEKNGNINLFKTYADGVDAYLYPRVWKGQQLLAPSKAAKYDPNKEYPLFFKPDKNVSFEDIANLFRTEYDEEDDEFKLEDGQKIIPISSSWIDSAHIIEIYDNLPAEMSNVLWLCNAAPKYGQFVPISNIVDKIPESYSTNLSEREYVEGVAACEFSKLNGIGISDPGYAGEKIVNYNKGIEKANYYAFNESIKEWESKYKKNPIEVKNTITKYCAGIMEDSADDAKRLTEELNWYLATQYYHYYSINSEKAVPEGAKDVLTFELCFDFEKVAKKYGYTVKKDDKNLIVTKDSKIITINYDEAETYYADQVDWSTGELLVTDKEKNSKKLEGRIVELHNIEVKDENSGKVKRYGTFVKNIDGKIMTYINLYSLFE